MLASRATSAYYTSAATATTTVTSSANPNVIQISCSASTGNNPVFTWNAIPGVTSYEVWAGSTVADPGTGGGTLRATVSTTTYTFQYTGNSILYAYVKATKPGGQVVESNHVPYSKNSNTSGSCI